MYSQEDDERFGPNARAAMLLLLLLALLLGGIYLFNWASKNELRDRGSSSRTHVSQDVVDENNMSADETAPLPDDQTQLAGEETNFRVSPDGASIAFLRGERFRRDVWVAPRNDLAQARPLGLAEEQGIVEITWALNGTHILYRRVFDIISQIYSVDVATGRSLALNPFEDMLAANFALSPWHQDELLIHMGPPPGLAMNLYRANLVTGEISVVEAGASLVEYYADSDFLVRAGRSSHQNGFSIHARREVGWEEVLFVARDLGERTGVLFLGAGHDLIYTLDDDGKETVALSSIDLATGERFIIAAHQEGDIVRVLRDPATREIFAYAVEGDPERWHTLDQSYAQDFEVIDQAVGGAFRVVSQSLDNSIWVIEQDRRYYVYDRGLGRVAPVFGGASTPTAQN